MERESEATFMARGVELGYRSNIKTILLGVISDSLVFEGVAYKLSNMPKLPILSALSSLKSSINVL